MVEKTKKNRGITIISLVITIIVLLILVGVSLAMVFNQNGIFKRAEGAGKKWSEAEARETLETVLLSNGQYEKRINPKYNQEDFLNQLIKNAIPKADIKGNIVIISGYAYEIDRSVPKIENYIGIGADLEFPEITVTEATVADDSRTATFTLTAIEETNGINKVELWLGGKLIEDQTKTYENEKIEITNTFEVNRDGVYTVKVYGKLMTSGTVTVSGIIPAVEFMPNGSTEWKKEHTTEITVREAGEKITSIKYKWTTSNETEPKIEEFIEECPADKKVTGKGEENKAGTYYLWVLLTMGEGEEKETNTCVSKGFNFDNEGPNITLYTTEKYSETGISLNVKAIDTKSGINKIECYIEDENKNEKYFSQEKNEVTWNPIISGIETGTHTCTIKVLDVAGNSSSTTKEAQTKLYRWEIFKFYKKGDYCGVSSVWRNYELTTSIYTDFDVYDSSEIHPTLGYIGSRVKIRHSSIHCHLLGSKSYW